MSTLRSGVKFAVFTVVTVLATALLAVTIGNATFHSTTPYHAVFADAVNLVPGDEVRVAGVRVGSIDGVSLWRGDQARVTFSVNTSVPLTTTTQAVIRYRNLIGQRYLVLVDAAGNGQTLRRNATIPLQRTQPALNLNTLFNGFRPLMEGLDPSQVNQLSYEIVRVLQGEGGTVDTLLNQVGSLTNSLADRDALIGQVIDNLEAVLGPLDQHDQQLSALIGNLQRFVTGLSGDRQAIGSALVSINDLAGTTSGLLRDARPALKTDVAQLGKLAERLDVPESRAIIHHFLVYSPYKLQIVTPTATYGSWLNFYICAADLILPNGTKTQTYVNTAARCHAPPGA